MGLTAILTAFAVAAIVAATEHVSVKYPRTWWYLRDCPALYAYAIAYGAIAALLAWQWPALAPIHGIGLEGDTTSPLTRAVLIGLVAKALTGVNLMTLNVNGTAIPVGTGIVTRLFEPALVRNIVFHEFQAVQAHVGGVAKLYGKDIERVRARALDAVPPGLPTEDAETFRKDVRGAKSTEAVLSLYLGFAGRKAFRTVFDRPAPHPALV